ncbi:MAG: hypothetical protein ACFFAH_06300 [Promethearchaeota archaeon]
MKDLYEIGIVFRGTILLNHYFKEIPGKEKKEPHKDLKGSFISAINSFVSKTFNNDDLEYLESGNFIFIFKIGQIKAKDNTSGTMEPIIFYGLVEKNKKPQKQVKLFLNKVNPLLKMFLEKYNNINFTTEFYQIQDFEFELLSI